MNGKYFPLVWWFLSRKGFIWLFTQVAKWIYKIWNGIWLEADDVEGTLLHFACSYVAAWWRQSTDSDSLSAVVVVVDSNICFLYSTSKEYQSNNIFSFYKWKRAHVEDVTWKLFGISRKTYPSIYGVREET